MTFALLLLAACAHPAAKPEDGDGDGFTAPADCDDTEPTVNPDGDELLAPCDGLDNDCDGNIDDGRRVPTDYALPSEAVAAASGGDIVCVQPGTYVDNVDFGGKDLQMIGVEGAERTILMGVEGAGSVVRFHSAET